MSFESLIVKLKSGATYYFPAGSVSGDPSHRVDNLRFSYRERHHVPLRG